LTLRDLNKALVGKRLCKWFEKPDLLWKQLIHQKFYAYRNILEMDSFLPSTLVSVENGFNSFYWHDHWIGPLASLYPDLFNLLLNLMPLLKP